MTPEERLARLDEGSDPNLIARMASGFAVAAEVQYLPGYCLLLAFPLVGQLNDLSLDHRGQFLSDMANLGEAVMQATGCRRINYGIYGNVDPFLHVHVWPRYDWEDPPLAKLPPLGFPDEFRSQSHGVPGVGDGALFDTIRMHLTMLIAPG